MNNPQYQPSGKFSPQGILALVAVATLVSGLLGAAVAYIGVMSGIYLVIFFPYLMGLALSFSLDKASLWGKVRNPLLVSVFAVIAGLTMYGSMKYGEYTFGLQAAMEETKPMALAETDLSEAEFETLFYEFVDEDIFNETGSKGLIGYMLYEAKEGVEIGKPGSDNGINIGTTGTWILWLVELGIMIGVPFLYAKVQSNKPFCEASDEWYDDGAVLGRIDAEKQHEALELFQNGSFKKISSLFSKDDIQLPYLQFVKYSCQKEGCTESQPILQLQSISRDSKGNIVSNALTEAMVPVGSV